MAGGIKVATGEVGGRMREGTEVLYIHGESSEQQGYFRARYTLLSAVHPARCTACRITYPDTKKPATL